MKKVKSILVLCLAPILVFGQLHTRKEINIPDIPGYLTLKFKAEMVE